MNKINLLLLFIFFNFYIYSNEYKMIEINKGETLWKISKKYGVSLKELCDINNINDVTKVKYGTIIKIPIKNNDNNNKENNYSNQNNNDDSEYIIHILKKNETLWKISRKYNLTVEELCRINNITDIKKIKTGTKIKIPDKFQYYECTLPLKGQIAVFSTYHFSGIYIFVNENKDNRLVNCIEDGQVSYIDNIPGYGTTIFIRHKDGYVSVYSGFDEVYVKKNDEVKKNRIIGIAGNLSRYEKYGIIFSIQLKGQSLKFNIKKGKFIKKG